MYLSISQTVRSVLRGRLCTALTCGRSGQGSLPAWLLSGPNLNSLQVMYAVQLYCCPCSRRRYPDDQGDLSKVVEGCPCEAKCGLKACGAILKRQSLKG